MTDHDSPSADDSDSVGDLHDDGQLTIRIPNPKHYMARQSQWKGRRGKPRCDHCRVNNLKVKLSLVFLSSISSQLYSVIGFYPPVITVRGQMEEIASIHHYRRPRTVESLDVTDAVSKT
jgi:hypothetical protein